MKICPKCEHSDNDNRRFCKNCGTELFFPERFTGSGGVMDNKKTGERTMFSKTIKLIKYILFTILANAIYGVILYMVFTRLADYSLVFAFFGNILLILIILASDSLMLKTLHSKKYLERIKKEKNPEQIYLSLKWSLENFGSFKTDLYMFYIVILIASQIIEFNPALVNESLGNFISANSYSILFLIAFDTLINQYGKDRMMMKKILKEIKNALNINHDEKEAE